MIKPVNKNNLTENKKAAALLKNTLKQLVIFIFSPCINHFYKILITNNNCMALCLKSFN
jgi:hypothetical protein